ncbi:TPA: O-acetylhomoserine aminocarboxypropyltransferase/cysteine synthase [Clostridioides difficile]|nr:O-acetylhomoserine sulfhydrylase [Clostridioides difficile]VIG47324.1 O-acetylhomoserine sulfhydrylase [Clostridioides difficile]HAU5069156.1 O-acetylhomoserine aminocarboxypropyltransferase/cysteine synthase [Clostridioides difficile]HAU5232469.1 O-acetylhomoserine aminocarboxypropyltransferase/cysteine synthase [Clostridioides difficile]HAU5259845.1 O-acetylhomoserine aminocarboxypropyltransferase/cysteine synthase [Clostridioides difficile]
MYNKETICVQGNYKPGNGEPRVLPLYQSTTFKYSSIDQLAELFDLKVDGHIYSRISNPTIQAFEEKISLLEGGVASVAVSSGQSANMLAVLNICKSGDSILCSSKVYGGTFNLLGPSLKKFGINLISFDLDSSEDEIVELAKENTKVVFAETLANPTLEVIDFEKIANVAKRINVPFIVDNSLASPVLCNPLKYGANIVTHSTTKYLDGHASSVGGIIVDGGNFNWDNGKFPELVEPDPTYHGISYTQKFGNAAYATKARVQLLRDYGNCLSPFNAYLTNLNVETLHLRMERHSENAFKIAKFLEKHENVDWINYPGLEDNKYYENAKKYLSKGCSGVLSFGVRGGLENAKKFVEKLQIASLVTHVSDVRTCVIHPASTTHRQLTEEQLIASGVLPSLIRLSVGIENVEDLIADLNQALNF